MARRYVGYSPRGPAVYRNVRRAPNGDILILLEKEEIDDLELDFEKLFTDGETISSATVTPEHITVSSTLSSPKLTLNLSKVAVSDLSGKITALLTFSSGEVWKEIIRVRRPVRHLDPDVGRDDGTFIEAADPSVIRPGAASITIGGQIPIIVLDQILQPAAASISITGQAPTVAIDALIQPAAGTLNVTGQTPTIVVNANIAPGAGSITVTGQAPTIAVDQILTPASESITVAGQTPAVAIDQIVQPAAESITLTGQVPVVDVGAGNVVVQPGAGSITATGQAPSIAIDQIVQPGAESVTVTGQAPTIIVDTVVAPASESITLAGQVPVVSVTNNDVTVEPSAGALNVTGQAPSIAIDQIVSPAAESVTITGQAPVVDAGGVTEAWEEITTSTITSSTASADFTGLSSYRKLRITYYLEAATDGADLWIRTSTDNGSSYDSGASDYSWVNLLTQSSTDINSQDQADAQIKIVDDISNDTNHRVSGQLFIQFFNQTSDASMIGISTDLDSSENAISGAITGARVNDATARDAIRIQFSSGNIESGYIVLEGA